MSEGYVYCIELDKGCVKIGRSVNPTSRIREIISHNCNNDARSFVSTCVNHTKLENDLHKMFKHHRVKGSEKFTVEFEDVCQAIDTLQKDGMYSPHPRSVDPKSRDNGIIAWKNMFLCMHLRERFVDFFIRYMLWDVDMYSECESFDDDGNRLTESEKHDMCIADLESAYIVFIRDIINPKDIAMDEIALFAPEVVLQMVIDRVAANNARNDEACTSNPVAGSVF